MLINSIRYKFILMFFDGKISMYGLLDLMGKSVTLSNLEATKKQRLIRLVEVQNRVGLSNSYIYALQAKGLFPKPIKLIEGGRACGYIESEIDDFIEERILLSRG